MLLLLAILLGANAETIDRTIYFRDSTILGPHPWKQENGLTVDGVTYGAGVAFRTWAPNADANTAYIQPQGGASWPRTQMTKNNTDGTFYVNIGSAAPGDGYNFQFTYQGGAPFTRIDPRSQAISNGVGKAKYDANVKYEYVGGGMRISKETYPEFGYETSWSYSIVQDDSFDWSGSSYITPNPSTLVVYELHIPTFTTSGSSPGTFDTAINQLPWLASMGINAVEIMPSATFAGSANGWGYNPCAYYAVMNEFGGYQALKRFVKAANQQGIAVLLDIVFNHVDGGSSTLLVYDGWPGAYGTGIYFYQDTRAETPWGPRPNYDNSQVMQYLTDNVQMWITDYHISGFRWDSTICIRHGGTPGVACYDDTADIDQGWVLMQNGNAITQASRGWSTAEDTQTFTSITLPISDQSAGLPGAPGGAGFNTQWDEPYYYTLEPALVLSNNINVNLGSLASMLTATDGEDPHRLMYTENHDKASNQQNGRIPALVNPGGNPYSPTVWAFRKAYMGIGTMFTSSMVTMLFYGMELLTYASFNYPVPPNIDWNLANANPGASLFIKDFIYLRLNKGGYSSGLTGNTTAILMQVSTSTDKVLVYTRSSKAGDQVLVVANWYNTQYTSFTIYNIPYDGTWYFRLNSDSTRYCSQFGNFGTSQTSVNVVNGQATIQIPMYSMLVLTRT